MRRSLVIATLFLSLLLFGAWMFWAWWAAGEDPQLTRVKDMQRELFGTANTSTSLSEDERRQRFATLREEMDKLDETSRQSLFRELRESREEAMAEQIRRFTQMTSAEKDAYLDQQIDRMEAFRNQRQQANRGTRPPSNPSAQRRTGRGPGGWQNMTEEQREQRRRNRLDSSDPTRRAEFAAYFEALRERRKERGLEDMRRRPF